MPTFGFPTNAELTLIAQEKRATLTLEDPIFLHFPIITQNAETILWEQRDNYVGLQQVRGLGGQFSRVNPVGAKRFSLIPGYFGESAVVDELALTSLRPLGTFDGVMDATDLVLDRQEQLLSREIDRMRHISWALLSAGTFAVQNDTGGVTYTDSYPVQSYTATVPWATRATATPFLDLMNLNTLGRGKGVAFDSRATAYVNQTTMNNVLMNSNNTDLFGRRGPLGASIFTPGDLNTLLLQSGLPKLVVMDDGYLNEAGTFVPYIADARAVVVGHRLDASSIGNIVETRNASNAGSAPGPYDAAIESERPPKTIEVFRGVNYGSVIAYPGSVVRMNL